jgi:hypothetical protein
LSKLEGIPCFQKFILSSDVKAKRRAISVADHAANGSHFSAIKIGLNCLEQDYDCHVPNRGPATAETSLLTYAQWRLGPRNLSPFSDVAIKALGRQYLYLSGIHSAVTTLTLQLISTPVHRTHITPNPIFKPTYSQL